MAFHVPEPSRVRSGPMASDPSCGNNGAFTLPSPEPGWLLLLICSDGTENPDKREWQWEHCSIQAARNNGSGQSRLPTWTEMHFVKETCWDDEDVVMQLHPRKSEYVNNHPHVLHLWRPKLVEIPTPPSILVGVR